MEKKGKKKRRAEVYKTYATSFSSSAPCLPPARASSKDPHVHKSAAGSPNKLNPGDQGFRGDV
jgi:hypothetical protein